MNHQLSVYDLSYAADKTFSPAAPFLCVVVCACVYSYIFWLITECKHEPHTHISGGDL